MSTMLDSTDPNTAQPTPANHSHRSTQHSQSVCTTATSPPQHRTHCWPPASSRIESCGKSYQPGGPAAVEASPPAGWTALHLLADHLGASVAPSASCRTFHHISSLFGRGTWGMQTDPVRQWMDKCKHV